MSESNFLTKTEKQTIISLCKEKINELQLAYKHQSEEERETTLYRLEELTGIIEKIT